jgi:uncharacterized iron-regulated membrane protein
VRAQGPDSLLSRAVGSDVKGKVSWMLYASAIGLAFIAPLVSNLIYVAVALVWLVPDRRIERALAEVEE